jgi:hypothetical protein
LHGETLRHRERWGVNIEDCFWCMGLEVHNECCEDPNAGVLGWDTGCGGRQCSDSVGDAPPSQRSPCPSRKCRVPQRPRRSSPSILLRDACI